MAFALGTVSGFMLCLVLLRRKRNRPAPPPMSQPVELPPDVKSLVHLYRSEGRTVDAIKLVRERTGCDLATAKNLVDHVR
jgi:hypothetical protein